jgi:tRNA A37 threonylcarbamoyltransferase TsaD
VLLLVCITVVSAYRYHPLPLAATASPWTPMYRMNRLLRTSSVQACGGNGIGQSLRCHMLSSMSTSTSAEGLDKEQTHSHRSRRSKTGAWIAKGFNNPATTRIYSLDKVCKTGLPDRTQPYLVLGIESSCDDTGVAIVRSDGKILSNVVHSQHAIHHKFGGIVPMLAMNAHRENINKALEQALREAGLSSVSEVDAIAVTKGPGLEVCLDVGFQKARQIAKEHKKPFACIHHLEAHSLIARLCGEDMPTGAPLTAANSKTGMDPRYQNVVGSGVVAKVSYPYLTFLASGGHTSILLTTGLGKHTVLGGTLDDALGEAFDKAARLLGLPLNTSGGAAVEAGARRAVERAAAKGTTLSTYEDYGLKIPMRDRRDCDFSYAGRTRNNIFIK